MRIPSIRVLAERYRLALSCAGIVAMCGVILPACEAGDPANEGATIVFTSAPTELRGGQTADFDAHLERSNGETADVEVQYELQDEEDASYGDLDPVTGEFTAAVMIFDDVTVNIVAFVADANVEPVVKPLVVRSRILSITTGPPLTGSMGVGDDHQLNATFTYASGSPTTPAPMVFWQSSSNAVLVDANGLITAVSPTPAGQPAQITANAEGITSAPISVTVVDAGAAVASVLVEPVHVSIAVTQTQQYTARAFNGAGAEVPGATFTWSGTTAAASVSGTGLVTGLASGGALVRATASGVTGTGAVSVGAVGSILAPLVTVGAGGPPLEGATLTALNGTVTVGTGTTNRNGRGYIPGLPPGTYTVTVSRTGFQTHTYTGIVVVQNQTTSIQNPVEMTP